MVFLVVCSVGDGLVTPPPRRRRRSSDTLALSRRAVLGCVMSFPIRSPAEMCPDQGYCASSEDDVSKGGRNFVEPWMYDGDWRAAQARLVDAIGTGVTVDDRSVRARTNMDDVAFYFTPGDVTIQVHSVSSVPFPGPRLDQLRVKCGFDKVDVLRNRRRTFLVISSPFDTFGPSTLDPASLFSDTSRDVDPLSPNFRPPDAQTRRWLSSQ